MRTIVILSCLMMSCTNSSFARITKAEDPQAASCLAQCRADHVDKQQRFICVAMCPSAVTGRGDCAPYLVRGPQHCTSKTEIAPGKTLALVAGLGAIGFFAAIVLLVSAGGK
jgi:hypothetical protein